MGIHILQSHRIRTTLVAKYSIAMHEKVGSERATSAEQAHTDRRPRGEGGRATQGRGTTAIPSVVVVAIVGPTEGGQKRICLSLHDAVSFCETAFPSSPAVVMIHRDNVARRKRKGTRQSRHASENRKNKNKIKIGSIGVGSWYRRLIKINGTEKRQLMPHDCCVGKSKYER